MAKDRPKSGLGQRLSEILANTPEYRPEAATALFGEGSAPSEEPTILSEKPIILAIPEYIDFIDQAPYSRSPVRTRRPDAKKKYGFYRSGPSTSTRVHAMQWIPTTGGVSNPTDELDRKGLLYGHFGSQNIFGDILIAFARPSNVQSHALYVYENNSEMMWRSLKSSPSLGSQVNYLSGGRPYQDADGHRYKELHKDTMDGGYPYDYWIFNEMDRWSTIRPNNERL